MVFAPYNFRYPELGRHADLAALVGEFKDDDGVTQTRVNKWNLVFDFTTNDSGKSNFSLLEPKDFAVAEVSELLPEEPDLRGACDFLFELPTEFGGNLDSGALKKAKDNLMVFDIKTGAEKAQKMFEESEKQKPLDS